MRSPNLTKGDWNLILESSPQLGVRRGQIIIPIISNLPFKTEEQRVNAKAMLQTPNMIKKGIRLLEKAESFDEFGAFAEDEIEEFKQVLIDAGCEK